MAIEAAARNVIKHSVSDDALCAQRERELDTPAKEQLDCNLVTFSDVSHLAVQATAEVDEQGAFCEEVFPVFPRSTFTQRSVVHTKAVQIRV